MRTLKKEQRPFMLEALAQTRLGNALIDNGVSDENCHTFP